jgi:nitroreductase
MDVLDAIFARRSVGRMEEPAPTDDELRVLLEAAVAAPDHGELRPWKFFVLRGAAKDSFGAVLAGAYERRCQADGVEPHPDKLEKERTKLGRAPLVVIAAAVHQPVDKVPWIEQQAAAAAASQNVLLAATALGYGSMWRTGDPAYDPEVMAALGLRPDDAIVAFLSLGTPKAGSGKEPRRPSVDGFVEEWQPPAGDHHSPNGS